MIIVCSFPAAQIAAQCDSLSGEKTLYPFGILDIEQLAEALFDLRRVCTSQNLSAEREVKFTHLARLLSAVIVMLCEQSKVFKFVLPASLLVISCVVLVEISWLIYVGGRLLGSTSLNATPAFSVRRLR